MQTHVRWPLVLPTLIVALLAFTGGVAQSDTQSVGQTPGTWVNVTPANVVLGAFGVANVVDDPSNPSTLYSAMPSGLWRSTDFGQTWQGPINTGPGGSGVSTSTGLGIVGNGAGVPPTLYSAGIQGGGNGFWRSLDGGVSWTNFTIGPAAPGRQDSYFPAVDPYDGNHLLMSAHENNTSYQSVDGGQTWTLMPQSTSMNEPGGTAWLAFVNTGNAATTRNTWLWLAQGTGGKAGTWRTADAGASWLQVDTNEHPHGNSQLYQPDTGGVIYMAGVYSALGWGVLRSSDYGQTWIHVGSSTGEAIVFGTPNNVYADWSWACGACTVSPALEQAAQPGINRWSAPSNPPGMSQGGAQAAVVFDGSNWVIVTANWTAGLWRYIEPAGGAPVPTSTPRPTVGTATSTSVPSTPKATSTAAAAAADSGLGAVNVTGAAANHSSVRVFYDQVPGARDYRVYDVVDPANVKYAGLSHRFVGGMPVDGVATDIEWNSLGNAQPHTLVVEAVDQLGPVPHEDLYQGLANAPLVPGGMLGSNKGKTDDGKLSTNGQGPYTNAPKPIARSQPFVVQADPSRLAIPSGPNAAGAFFDTFENAEGATLKQLSRSDSTTDAFGNLGQMLYSLNAGTPREWAIDFRQTDNTDSMPFIASDHFMDMVFDGATPGTNAPPHTTYGSMAMSPVQTVDLSGGHVLHMTMEVDAHQSFRRWVDFNLAPASDPLERWDFNGAAIDNTNQGAFLEIKEGGCTLDVFTGPSGSPSTKPTGTAGGAAHGARLWGQAGSTGGAPIMCGLSEMFNPATGSGNGLGLDDRSRLDFFISQTHAAFFEDGRLVVQSDIPAGSFPWANQPLKAYFSHYLYHSDADLVDLKSFVQNGVGLCYPLNSFWFNDPVNGTTTSSNDCGLSYPPGYGFPYSDERHWDNMGLEVLPAPADFASFASLVQGPQTQAPTFVPGPPTGTPAPVPPTATPTDMPMPMVTPTATASPTTMSTAVPSDTPTPGPVATDTPVPTDTPPPVIQCRVSVEINGTPGPYQPC